MATKRLTLKQVEEAVWEAVAISLGYDTTGDEAHSAIRKAWPTTSESGSNPEWLRLNNYCFIRIVRDTTDPYANGRETNRTYDEATGVQVRATEYTAVWTAQLIFSGPNAPDRAETVRQMFFSEDVRRKLRVNELYPVPHASPAFRGPELYQGQWWDRSDLALTLYERVREETEEEFFTSVPMNVGS